MKPDKPIIRSRLDDDFYTKTLGQIVFFRYPDVRVRYALKCRTTGLKLAEAIDLGRLREELRHVETLPTTPQELHYIGGVYEYGEPMFRHDFLMFLKDLALPKYHVDSFAGDLVLEFEGPWPYAINGEMPALAVISELYYEWAMQGLSRFERLLVLGEGRRRLAEKRNLIGTRPGLPFADFGTRRRFSRAWQQEVVGILAEELPKQFRGTSNTRLAYEYGLIPMGTNSHQHGMVLAGLAWGNDEAVHASQRQVLQDQWDFYGHGLSVALPDTFGSEYFFDRVMTEDQARQWKGVRQDSGVPEQFFDRALAFYQRADVDPESKLFIPSDGLTAPRMIEIFDYVNGRMVCSPGWGTNLMNDLGFDPISIVVKPVSANGRGLVKLSDNLAKAIGRPEDIKEAKRVFGYTSTTYQECVY